MTAPARTPGRLPTPPFPVVSGALCAAAAQVAAAFALKAAFTEAHPAVRVLALLTVGVLIFDVIAGNSLCRIPDWPPPPRTGTGPLTPKGP